MKRVLIALMILLLPQTVIADEKPEVVVQSGHASAITSLAISPDGRFIVSGAGDSLVKLWDMNSAREMRSFKGHGGLVRAVSFSPDNKLAASAAWDRTAKVWNIATGETVINVVGAEKGVYVNAVSFSPDGTLLATGGQDQVIRLWSLKSGKLERELTFRSTTGYVEPVSGIAFSPDGTVLYGAYGDGLVRVWKVSSGKMKFALTGHQGMVWSVAASADGKWMASGGEDGKVIVRDTRNHRVTEQSKMSDEVLSVAFDHASSSLVASSKDGRVSVWQRDGMRSVFSEIVQKKGVWSVAFAPSDTSLLAAGADGSLLEWQLPDMRQTERFSLQSVNGSSIEITADGGWIASSGPQVSIWNSRDGKRLFTLPVGTNLFRFTPSRHLITAGFDGNLTNWDIEQQRQANSVHLGEGKLASIDVSADGKSVVVGDSEGRLHLWNPGSSSLTHSPAMHKGWVHGVVFLDGGKRIVSAGEDGDIKFWDASTMRMIRSVHPGSQVDVTQYGLPETTMNYTFYDVQVVPNGSLIALRHAAGVLFVDAESGRIKQQLYLLDDTNGKAVQQSGSGILQYMKNLGGQMYQDFTRAMGGSAAMAFSDDGRFAFIATGISQTIIWDLAQKQVSQIINGSDSLRELRYDSVNHHFVGAASDGSIAVWNEDQSHLLVRHVPFADGEWITATPKGYFNASSPKAAEHLNIRQGLNVYGINQFYDVFYRPDIVKAALAGKDTSSMVTLTIDEAIKNPPPMIEKAEAPASSKADKVKVAYTIKSEGGGIGEVRVFHNGKLVKSDGFIRNAPQELFAKNASELTSEALEGEMRSISIKAKKDKNFKRITETAAKPDLFEDFVEIEPIPGENEVAIIAFNAQNSVQSLTKTVTFKSDKAPVKPRLHILTVGIDQYKDVSSNLKYAVKDSTDMASKLKAQAASIYGAENIFVTSIANASASRAGILSKIKEVSANVKPTDHFVLFVASHGVLLGDQYYMVTNDYDGTLNPSKLISSNEIVDLSKQIKALSQLYIIDTCHAGGMDGVVSGLYDARMSVLAKKMGLHVFASSNSVEQALDGYKGNGLFTHTLLDALNNNTKADKNTDKQVSLMELGSYSKAETKQIAEGLGHAQEPLIINFGQDNPVYTLH